MIRAHAVTPIRAAALGLALTLAGCSSVETFLTGDKVDYRTQAAKTAPLDVPPDLNQLARETRYQPQSGVVSANAMNKPAAGSPAAAATATAMAPTALGELRIERLGDQRWLVTNLPPEKLWTELRAFWVERGFNLELDNPEVGVMETNWAENRAKIPQDAIRSMLGKVISGLYDSGERDRYRTRVERTAKGSEVYISHRGMAEVYTDSRKENTAWRARATDPQLEAEFLTRLMLKLGAKDDVAKTAVAQAPDSAVPVRPVVAGQATSLEVADTFDRTWRRVGLTLDRSGFTVEDRDRAAGLYFVRYVDPKFADQEEPGFFSKLFGAKDQTALQRYRVLIKSNGDKSSTVSVQNSAGAADTSEAAKAIIARLTADLK